MLQFVLYWHQGGIHGSYEKGKEITGLGEIDQNTTIVFHAGTKKEQDKFVTSGGRVLGVTSIGKTIEEVKEIAYNEVKKIDFEGVQYRKDIWK